MVVWWIRITICVSCLDRSLLECPPAVEKVGGSIPGREMSVSGALVEDVDDLGKISL